VNFNHLMESRLFKRKCKATNAECYYIPAGNIRSTHGENVHLTMVCKKCGVRQDVFLTKEEYFTQEKLIQREIGHA
jgi:transcription initiation factor IIE alpha subunit